MIRSFRDRDTERFFHGGTVPSFQGIAAQARHHLEYLDDVESLQELHDRRGNRLERLIGNRAGQYSIRLNRRWRLCFTWLDDGPHDVEIVDYHR